MVGLDLFDLRDRPVAITGAGGLLGQEHALAVGRAGGIPVLLDISAEAIEVAVGRLESESLPYLALRVDLTRPDEIADAASSIQHQLGHTWGLINNLAANPSMNFDEESNGRLETFLLTQWDSDIRVGLTSAFLCAQHFGAQMVKAGSGSIVNVASDLAIISPDNRIYATGRDDKTDKPVKPVSYSTVKSGLLGLTRYLATYWTPIPIRCNALLPGSVYGTQSDLLKKELKARIPMARLAEPNEYQGAIIFLLSDASSYMTGASLVIDGGRTTW